MKNHFLSVENALLKINEYKEKWISFVVRRFSNELTPNMLTMARIVLVLPLFIVMIYDYNVWAFVIYLFGCILDLFDGPLAREKGLVTEIGKVLDPLADKILFLIPLAIYSFVGNIVPITLAMILIILETFVITLRFINYFLKIKKENSANIFGKVKMWLESIAICMLFLWVERSAIVMVAIALLWLAALCATISVLKHVLQKENKKLVLD